MSGLSAKMVEMSIITLKLDSLIVLLFRRINCGIIVQLPLLEFTGIAYWIVKKQQLQELLK